MEHVGAWERVGKGTLRGAAKELWGGREEDAERTEPEKPGHKTRQKVKKGQLKSRKTLETNKRRQETRAQK